MQFFFERIFFEPYLKIFLSALVGIILGFERKNHFQPIGARTLILISVSCSLMGLLSFWAASQTEIFSGDPTRIAAGVLTGIGFIGGGAIIRQGFNIKGITTAAIIWITAALGLSFGFGMYGIALFALVLALAGLKAFQKVEDKFFPATKIKTLSLVYKSTGDADIFAIKNILKKNGIIVRDINFFCDYCKDTFKITILVNTPPERNFTKLANELSQTGTLQKFSFKN